MLHIFIVFSKRAHPNKDKVSNFKIIAEMDAPFDFITTFAIVEFLNY